MSDELVEQMVAQMSITVSLLGLHEGLLVGAIATLRLIAKNKVGPLGPVGIAAATLEAIRRVEAAERGSS